MVRIVLLAFLSALIGACATTGADKVAAIPSGKKLSVVSLMGNEAFIIHVGFTIFENDKILKDVADWRIDEFVVKEAEDIIDKGDRFTYTPATYDVSALESVELGSNPFTGEKYIDEMKPYLSDIVKNSDADIILLITSGSASDFVFGTNEQLRNYGVYRRNVLGIKRTAVFCNMDFIVVNGGDLSIIGQHNGGEFEFIDNKLWGEPIGNFNKDQIEYIKKAMQDLIIAELKNSMEKLRL